MPSADVNDPALREQVQPLTSVPDDVDPEIAAAAREASTDAFRLAMIVSAGLLLAGAAINGFGSATRLPASWRRPRRLPRRRADQKTIGHHGGRSVWKRASARAMAPG